MVPRPIDHGAVARKVLVLEDFADQSFHTWDTMLSENRLADLGNSLLSHLLCHLIASAKPLCLFTDGGSPFLPL